MLSYQHIYHAGNHADILKHAALTLLLEHLNAKKKPYTVFDTHAGSGRYDLSDERAEKTGESIRGIRQLLAAADAAPAGVPAALMPYLALVRSCDAQGFYPGSPEIERSLMRKDDVLVLSELHPQEILSLRKNMAAAPVSNVVEPHIQIHNRNGFEALRALTPPAIKRGLVLTDPSYEESSDYADCARAFSEVHRRWPSAVLALWYPLLARRRNELATMKDAITASVKTSAEPCEIMSVELTVAAPDAHIEQPLAQSAGSDTPRLYGSGMLIVNVPWKFDEEIETVRQYLEKVIK